MDVRVGDPQVQIRLGHLRHDLGMRDLRLTPWASEGAILSAVASYLDIGVGAMQRRAIVERSPAGNLLIRGRLRPA